MAGWHEMTRSLEGLFWLKVDSEDLSSLPVKYVDDWCMQEPEKQIARLSARSTSYINNTELICINRVAKLNNIWLIFLKS